MWSRFMLSAAYCDHISYVPFAKQYLDYHKKQPIIFIIRLKLSFAIGPKVIILSVLHCTIVKWLNKFFIYSLFFANWTNMYIVIVSSSVKNCKNEEN